MRTAMFDLREVRRAFILASCGTAIVVWLFALLIKAHPVSDEASASMVMKAGPAHLAEDR
jgi:hypothetical protein